MVRNIKLVQKLQIFLFECFSLVMFRLIENVFYNIIELGF